MHMTSAVAFLAAMVAFVSFGGESFGFASWNIGHFALGKKWYSLTLKDGLCDENAVPVKLAVFQIFSCKPVFGDDPAVFVADDFRHLVVEEIRAAHDHHRRRQAQKRPVP